MTASTVSVQVTTFKCELPGCDGSYRKEGLETPPGWLRGFNGMDFCSAEHLVKWMAGWFAHKLGAKAAVLELHLDYDGPHGSGRRIDSLWTPAHEK